MIDTNKAREITQYVANQLAGFDAIDTDSISVGAKRVKRTKKRGKVKAGAVSGWAKNPGYQFTAQFKAHGIPITDGFFLPRDAEEGSYDLESIIGYLTEGIVS